LGPDAGAQRPPAPPADTDARATVDEAVADASADTTADTVSATGTRDTTGISTDVSTSRPPDSRAGASAPRPALDPVGPAQATRTPIGAAPPPSPPPSPPPAPSLRARGLRLRYGGFAALDGVDLDVLPGRVSAVVGPNGAGKSTLFHCLAGTLRPDSGSVRLGERDITRLPAHARTRLGVGRTFQQLAVFPSLSVADNVRVGAEQGRIADPGAAERALRLFGLDGAVRTAPAAGLPPARVRGRRRRCA
ncbi:ATP-binding cassette domain-containing protein, partial [Streptomyces caniscabiei]|uniref:ATP-binding cassette domain-containing protein n=1 Tax=Streptomyces caniscabiei TaxID=2746961 RepID=UPI001F30BBAA